MIDEDNIAVNAETALSLSLLLHELAINAVRYGSLSNDVGRVRIAWQMDDERFRFQWAEEGGPPARPPTRKGFGSRLIAMGIRGSRHAELDYASNGLHASFEAARRVVIDDLKRADQPLIALVREDRRVVAV